MPGAHQVELGALPLAIADLDDGGSITVMCGHGERAMTGASLLVRAGGGQVAVAVGVPRRRGCRTRPGG